MPKSLPIAELDAVLQVVSRFPEGASAEEILHAFDAALPRRTLQRRLALLVEQGRLTVEGRGRASRYCLPRSVMNEQPAVGKLVFHGGGYIPVSREGQSIKREIRRPVQNRRPVGYNRAFRCLLSQRNVLSCEGHSCATQNARAIAGG